jgi:hypothetical protein
MTKRYTHKDFSHPIRDGFDTLLPIELPFVELKRGQHEFEIEGNKFKLEISTYGKELYSKRGGQYFQEQKCWSVVLVSGKDIYNICSHGSEFTATKSGVISNINSTVARVTLKRIMEEKGIERPDTFKYKEFVEHFETLDSDDKIKILQRQVDEMTHGLSKSDAFVSAFGYEPCEGEYISKTFMSNRRTVSIGRAIRNSKS